MRIGLHLPQFPTGPAPNTPGTAIELVRAAATSGFDLVATNDNLLFPSATEGAQRPWLDGPSLLAAISSVVAVPLTALCLALPLHRGPAMCARTLAALNALFAGRLTVALATGSSPRAHALAGVAPERPGAALEDATRLVRRLLGHARPVPDRDGATDPGWGDLADIEPLRSTSEEPDPPPVWLASWGSDVGLRRVVRAADGWLASAYTLDPDGFAARRHELHRLAEAAGRDPGDIRCGLATAFAHVTDGTTADEARVRAQLAEALGRRPDAGERRDLIGPPERIREHVAAYREAGADLLLLLPVGDPAAQVPRIAETLGVHPGAGPGGSA